MPQKKYQNSSLPQDSTNEIVGSFLTHGFEKILIQVFFPQKFVGIEKFSFTFQ
jgi:hypothetical protein